MAAKTHKVEIYSTPSCRFCIMAKNFFKENKIKFTDHNVLENRKDAMEMIEKTGQQGVPVIVIDNYWDEFILGFDEPELRRRLKIK